jgi:hypothetical protein
MLCTREGKKGKSIVGSNICPSVTSASTVGCVYLFFFFNNSALRVSRKCCKAPIFSRIGPQQSLLYFGWTLWFVFNWPITKPTFRESYTAPHCAVTMHYCADETRVCPIRLCIDCTQITVTSCKERHKKFVHSLQSSCVTTPRTSVHG